MTVEQSLERKFGGFPLPIVGGRALELTVVSPYKECQPSELTIDSATALVLEQQTHHSTERIDTFPCTRNEWHKHIFCQCMQTAAITLTCNTALSTLHRTHRSQLRCDCQSIRQV